MDSVAEMLSHLQLAEKAAISLDKSDEEYILHIDSQPCSNSSARLAASNSEGSIRLYTRHNLTYIGTVQGDGSTLTDVKFAHEDLNLIMASSKEGAVKCWDMRVDLMKPVCKFKGYKETHNVFTAFDLSCNDRVICAGTESRYNKAEEETDVYLIFWDHRQREQLGVYSESHQDDITQVCFHPTEMDTLMTGSTDGLACLFDISQSSEDDAIQTSLNTGSSVSTVGWCGTHSETIYSLTHIESLHMWGATEFEDIAEITDIKNKFTGSQKVDYLVDCFQPEGATSPVLLCGDYSGQLHLHAVQDNTLHHVGSLPGGHSAPVRCASWDSQSETLVTGGEDAMLCLWNTRGSQKALHPKHKLKVKSKKRKKGSAGSKPF